MNSIEDLIDQYYTWLKDETTFKKIEDWVEITTPYLDHRNDYIQIYLKQTGDEYILTDDGATIASLIDAGCTLDTPKRQEIFQFVLKGFGVHVKDQKLQIRATSDNFALRKHFLLQAILAVDDMFYLAQHRVESVFFEDVRDWLDASNIRYSETMSSTGFSGFSRKFDFIISKSQQAPERIITTINNPTKDITDTETMKWVDIEKRRAQQGSKAYAFINDHEHQVSDNITTALSQYQIKPVLWQQREQVKAELAA